MPNILVIDDDQDILKIIQRVLESNNLQAQYSTDARKALDIIRNDGIDLVITDILMPDFDGLELIRTLRGEFPQLKILAMSSGGSDKKKFQEYLVIAKRLGAHEIINKPIDINKLLSTIDTLVSPD